MIDWDAIRSEITRRRDSADWSQRALAERMGVSHVTVARIESGTFTPSLDMLARVADALGCRVVDLIVERRARKRRTK